MLGLVVTKTISLPCGGLRQTPRHSQMVAKSLVYVTQGANTEFGLQCYGTCRKVFTTDKDGIVKTYNYSGCC